jgi:hypothetical protein
MAWDDEDDDELDKVLAPLAPRPVQPAQPLATGSGFQMYGTTQPGRPVMPSLDPTPRPAPTPPLDPATSLTVPSLGGGNPLSDTSIPNLDYHNATDWKTPKWKTALGLGLSALAGGAAGYKNPAVAPQVAGSLAEGVINGKEDREKQYLAGLDAKSRQEANDQSEQALRAAQTNEANARATSLGTTKDTPAKVAFHFTDGQGNETAVFEDGTTKKFTGGAPAKPEDIKAMYAQAVQAAQQRGQDPTTDPTVQRLAKAQQMTEHTPDESGTWSLGAEDDQGRPIEINSKTGATRPAPTGINAKGTKKAADEAAAKANKPNQDLVDQYNQAQEFARTPSPTNDYALLMNFIGMSKPEQLGKLRLNTQELKLTEGTRSSLGDIEALAQKVANGEMLTSRQRQDMLNTMKIVSDHAAQNIKGGAAQGGGTGIKITRDANGRITGVE